MNRNQASARSLAYAIAAAILLVGLGSASLIYLSAQADSGYTLIQDFENSKRYRHDMEVIGGKMNVLMDQFCRWFASLWHGKALAVTIGWITLVISLGILLFARQIPVEHRPDADRDTQPGADSP